MKWLPLLFAVTLLDVEAQRVQLSLRSTNYGNNSLVKMEDIGEGDEALFCSTSFSPCCGTPPNRFGEWYYPSGSNVRPGGSGDTFYRSRLDDGTVRLHRRNGALPVGGTYKCTIPINRTDMTNIYVLILSENSIPQITRQPQHVLNADPGSTVSLSVVAINAQSYHWQVNDTDIHESDKYRGVRTSSLMIHNIEESDEGFYSCIVGNEYLSKQSNRAALTVLNSPSIVDNPEDQTGIEEGARVMFSITVLGLRLTFNWMFQNGSQIPDTDTKYSGQNTSVLTVFSVTYDDSASYQCQVSNRAGSVTSQPARLFVYKLSQIESFEAIPGISSIMLTWAMDEEPQNISYFCLKYFPVLFPNILTVVNTTEERYEAIGLIPQVTYVFQLQPILVEDGATQAMSIDVTLGESLPPVENVSAAASSETSVRVSWDVQYDLPGWSSLHFLVYYSARSLDGVYSVYETFEVNETSTYISIRNLALEAEWQLQFQVSAVLAVGVEGLELIESEKRVATMKIAFDGSLFQLLIGPTDYCLLWDVEKAKRFQLAIRQKIASVVSTSCACDFPLNLIDDGVFSCRTFHNFVVYRSKISGLFASDMIHHLSEWVETNPTLQVNWLLLNIHSTCSVAISSIDDPDCSVPLKTIDYGMNNTCV